MATALLLELLAPPSVLTQGPGIEWDVLNQEFMELYQTGQYDRAVVVAQKALEVAEQNTNPNHPAVATSLNKLAELYRTQGQYTQAARLYARAADNLGEGAGTRSPLCGHGPRKLGVVVPRDETGQRSRNARTAGCAYSSDPAMKEAALTRPTVAAGDGW